MVQFNADAKQSLGLYFGEGVHKVKIIGVIQDKNDNGSEYFEFGLEGENGEEGTARIYWTEKAQKYSFNAVRDIFVHNTKEANKDMIRAKVDATKDTDELFKLVDANLIDKEAWFKVEKAGTTYVNNNGETKNSYNRNLYGYEPAMKKQTAEDLIDEFKKNADSTPIESNDIPFGI